MIRRLTSLLGSALLAAAFSATSYVLQRRIGLNLADEGFLWCGARDTALGAQPIRDFDSYDPARYWWSAAFFKARGDTGLLTLRLAAAAWEALALFAFFRLSARRKSGMLSLFEAALLQIWMFPLYRSYDNAMPVLTTLVATRLIEDPRPRRFFEAGVAIGFSALVGRNHGVYSLVALGAVALLSPACRRRFGGASVVPVGIACGYAPIVALFALDPRFRAEFKEGIARQFRRGSTPAAIPVPWPWRVVGKTKSRRAIAESVLFLAAPLAYGATLARRAPAGPGDDPAAATSLAAACVGIAYLHYIYSRADDHHLATGIFPLLWIACAAGSVPRLGFAAATLAMSDHLNPLLRTFFASEPYRSVEVGREMLVLPDSEAAFLTNLTATLNELGARADAILFAPHFPALYPVFSKSTAVYEPYLILEATEERQASSVARMRDNDVRYAVVRDIAVDQNEGLRLQNTHAQLWRYVLQHFDRIPTPRLPADVLLLRRADPARNGSVAPPSSVRFEERATRELAGSGFFTEDHGGFMWVTPRVFLRLWIPPAATHVLVAGFLPDYRPADSPGQTVRCYLDGIEIGAAVPVPVGDFRAAFALPEPEAHGRAAVIELAFGEAFVPKVLGVSPDGRTLSALLSEVRFG